MPLNDLRNCDLNVFRWKMAIDFFFPIPRNGFLFSRDKAYDSESDYCYLTENMASFKTGETIHAS